MNTLLSRLACSLMLLTLLSTHTQAEEEFGFTFTPNVAYGKGKVTQNGVVVERNLLMDVYMPAPQSNPQKRPAVVLVHGGAFHRGGLRQAPFREDGAVHSAMQDYAKLLAPLGYVCFVIEYRLVPEGPVPGPTPDPTLLQPLQQEIPAAALARTNFARRAMGLSELTKNDGLILGQGVLSAAQDLDKAVAKIRASASDYGVDPERIALGGHSAGATTVLNAAYGIKSPVRAVFSLSPAVVGYKFAKTIDSPELPALLILMAQFDLDAMLQSVPYLMKVAQSADLKYDMAWVPGFGHFYPTGAVTLGDDATRMSVGERVINFLDEHL